MARTAHCARKPSRSVDTSHVSDQQTPLIMMLKWENKIKLTISQHQEAFKNISISTTTCVEVVTKMSPDTLLKVKWSTHELVSVLPVFDQGM